MKMQVAIGRPTGGVLIAGCVALLGGYLATAANVEGPFTMQRDAGR